MHHMLSTLNSPINSSFFSSPVMPCHNSEARPDQARKKFKPRCVAIVLYHESEQEVKHNTRLAKVDLQD